MSDIEVVSTPLVPGSAMAAEWDAWLTHQGPRAGFLQSSQWAAIDAALNGAGTQLVVARRGEVLAAGALLRTRGSRWASGVAADCHDGPVLGDDHEATERLLDEIDRFAAAAGAETVRLSPPATAAAALDGPGVADLLARSGYDRLPWLTRLVDIAADDATLAASFTRTARKAVRRAAEEGVLCVRCADKEEFLRLFARGYAEIAGAQARERLSRLWELDAARAYRFFVATDAAGAVLATLGTYRFNGVATEVMSGRTPAGLAAGAPAQDLLHLEALRAHRDEGDRLFDLAGYAPVPADDRQAGIRRFKEKFGGVEVEVGRYERSRSPVVLRGLRGLRGRLGALRARSR